MNKVEMWQLLGFICLNCLIDCNYGQTNEVPCPLVWKAAVSGEQIPSKAISTDGNEVYVARAYSQNNELVGGFFNNGAVFINNLSNVASNASDYEILTNPHNCVTEWTSSIFSRNYLHRVKVGTDSDKYIGRAWQTNGFLSGTDFSSKLYLTTLDGTRGITASSYDILRSYSKGLKLEADSFVFDNNPFEPSTDFMGLDEIYNGGDTYVRQIVSHKRRVKTTSKVSSSKFWGVTGKVSLSIGGDLEMGNTSLPMPDVKMSDEVSYKSENSEEIYDEKETEITVTKEVLVAPFTAVQICSTISMAENFTTNYIARGTYSSPGLSSQEVLAILNKEGKTGVPDGKGGVVTTEEGTFTGNMAVTTQFIVVPRDSPGGCDILQSKILKLKNDRKAKRLNRQQILERLNEIDNIIQGKF